MKVFKFLVDNRIGGPNGFEWTVVSILPCFRFLYF